MIIPFVEQWPQAMAMTAIPANTREHFSNLLQLMDDIWYHAGDRSTDVSHFLFIFWASKIWIGVCFQRALNFR